MGDSLSHLDDPLATIYNDILDFNSNIPSFIQHIGISNKAGQALWIELRFAKQSNTICGVICRQHNSAFHM